MTLRRPLLVLFVLLIAAAPVLAGPLLRSPRVVDGNGRVVGVYDDAYGGAAKVYVKHAGLIVEVPLAADGSQDCYRHFWFETSDCSSKPLFLVETNALLLRTTAATGARCDESYRALALFYAGEPIQMRTIRGYKFTTDPTDCASRGGLVIGDSCCLATATALDNWSAPAVELGWPYVPPYRVR